MPGTGPGADKCLRALVGRRSPGGGARRGAVPPVVPPALPDHPGAPGRLSDAFHPGDGRDRSPNGRPRAVRAVPRWPPGDGAGAGSRRPHPRPAPTAAAGRPGDGRADGGGGRGTVPVARGRAGRGVPAVAVRDRRPGPAGTRPRSAGSRRLGTAFRTGGLRRGEPAAEVLAVLLAGRGTGGPLLPTGRAVRAAPPGDRCPVTGRGGSRTVVRWGCSARRTEGAGRFTNAPPRGRPRCSAGGGEGTDVYAVTGCRCLLDHLVHGRRVHHGAVDGSAVRFVQAHDLEVQKPAPSWCGLPHWLAGDSRRLPLR